MGAHGVPAGRADDMRSVGLKYLCFSQE